jgi:predicted aspartyl protease
MLLVSVSVTATSGTAVVSRGVPFATDEAGTVVVPVWIAGNGPFRFVLDTGSTGSAVSDALADRLVLPPIARAALLTAGGDAMRVVVRLSSVTLGAVTRDEVLATLATRDELAILGGRIDGILGVDFLDADNFTVDYQQQRFTWDGDTASPPGRVVRLPLALRDGRFVTSLPQAEAWPLELVPDSGASTVVLFDRDGVAPPRLPGDTIVTVAGLTGTQDARATRLRQLSIGTLTLRDVPAIVIARDEGRDAADGLLPLHAFSRVSFRPSEGVLVLER